MAKTSITKEDFLSSSLKFLMKGERILAGVEMAVDIMKKIGRQIENYTLYGPSYYALQLSKNVKEYFENSEMAKALNLNLGSQFASPFGAVQYWEDIQRAINRTNMTLGIGGQVAKNMREDLIKSRSYLLGLGTDIDNFTQSYSTFVSEYGRPFAPSVEDIENMAIINKSFEGQFDSLIPIAKLYGRSIQDTRNFINDAMVKSDKYGISVNKVLENIQKNISMVDRYTFKGGLEGLKKMSIESQKLNLNMSSVAQFSEKFYNPEDAIEMAASLQMMGGEFAQFGDVFQLMYDANNDVGALTEKISDLTKGMGMLNKKTGEIEFTSIETRKLKRFEELSGISVEEMKKTSRVRKQEDIVRKYISPEFAAGSKENLDEYVNKLAMLAEFKGGIPKITIDNKQKLISEISQEDLERLSTVGLDPLKDPLENLIEVNRTANKKLQDIFEQIVILANDFETLNKTELTIKAQQEFAKTSAYDYNTTGMLQKGEKNLKINSMERAAGTFQYMTNRKAPFWADVITQSVGGDISKGIVNATMDWISGKESKSSVSTESNLKTYSTFSEIQNNKEKVDALVREYGRMEQASKFLPNGEILFKGEGSTIKLELDGREFKRMDLLKDKAFKDAWFEKYQKSVDETILSTSDNGGRNVTPLKPR